MTELSKTSRPINRIRKELKEKVSEARKVHIKLDKLSNKESEEASRYVSILRSIDKEIFDLKDELFGPWKPKSWSSKYGERSAGDMPGGKKEEAHEQGNLNEEAKE